MPVMEMGNWKPHLWEDVLPGTVRWELQTESFSRASPVTSAALFNYPILCSAIYLLIVIFLTSAYNTINKISFKTESMSIVEDFLNRTVDYGASDNGGLDEGVGCNRRAVVLRMKAKSEGLKIRKLCKIS